MSLFFTMSKETSLFDLLSSTIKCKTMGESSHGSRLQINKSQSEGQIGTQPHSLITYYLWLFLGYNRIVK